MTTERLEAVDAELKEKTLQLSVCGANALAEKKFDQVYAAYSESTVADASWFAMIGKKDLVDYQKRVLDECIELRHRLQHLSEFIKKGSPGASQTQRALLQAQFILMYEYACILKIRLEDF